MFSFLYRVFYDRTLFSVYIKTGKGYGLKPLFFLAVFTAFCLMGRVFFLFSSFSPQVAEEFISQVPEIIFEKGKITVPDDYRYVYVSQKGNLFFVFDTKDSLVNLKNMPPFGLYITKDALVTVRRNELRRIPFVNILNKFDFTLSQEDLRQSVKEAVSLSKIFVPPIVFVFYSPFFFSSFLFMAVVFFILSFVLTQIVKVQMTTKERLRLVALSIMPAGVINGVGMLLNAGVLLEPLSMAVVLVYMYCFLKDGQTVDDKA
ncbi:MAG: DUF1189 family protein [Alphaproteobacteria bacterium]|nr:DUF1189 family protein [Alphaproteobacteria bacterium]